MLRIISLTRGPFKKITCEEAHSVLPGVAISRQSGYFGKPVAGKNLWLVATMIVAIFGLKIGLFVATFGLWKFGMKWL